MGVRCRQGERDLGRGGMEARTRRHPCQGRQTAETPLPNLDQCSTPEDSGDCQAGLPKGRHRGGIEVGYRVGLLLLGCANPDTYGKFNADIQMYNTNLQAPDPELFMRQFVSWEVA